MVLPITLADDHHRVRVLRVIPFRPREETPRLRLHAHEVEEIAGHHFAPNLRGSRRVTYREYVSHSRGYEVDQMQVVAEIAEVQVRRRKRRAIRRRVLDRDNALRLRSARQWIQQHRPHPTEHSRASPNA